MTLAIPGGAHPLPTGVAVLTAIVLFACLRIREGRRNNRAQGLETAVRQRTRELESERVREKAHNRILEMLVSRQPLSAVLDAVVLSIQSRIPGARCVIALKRAERWQIAAGTDIPREWRAALAEPCAVPFEVARHPARFGDVVNDPAWRALRDYTAGAVPAVIQSHPVGDPDAPLGAILLFEAEPAEAILEAAGRLATIAVEQSRFHDYLAYQAQHDHLTGLPNRALFEERLAGALAEAKDRGQKVAVLFLDLDRFRQVNESMGHRAGDLLLAEIASRMRRALRPSDTVARIGGDEFNAIVTNIRLAAEAEDIAGRLLDALRQPFSIEGRAVAVSASLGIALFPDDGIEGEALRREADAAMYCAKGQGRNRFQSFGTRNKKLETDRELRLALHENRFEVYYQPKVGADGGFGGLEALIRLNHPVNGLVAPAGFIPIAEESGLIVSIGEFVLNEVCRQIADWQARGIGVVPVAVNVSPVQIARLDFAESVRGCLSRHSVPGSAIELELTENLLIAGSEETQRQMRELRSLGIHLSIDDFGTGYSSLSYLHRLQVDGIKLDRSFVHPIVADPAARRLVQAMIGVAEGLGLNVIAEGVETEAQRTVLVAAGCRMMQGFLFARPQPAAQVESWLRCNVSDPDGLIRLAVAVAGQPAGAEAATPAPRPV
jgi:diguanylate cyclase (GGDEF)-like protein